MIPFDDLHYGTQIALRLRWVPELMFATFEGFSREVKRSGSRRKVIYRMLLRDPNGKLIMPRTCDIVGGAVYLAGSYQA